MPGTCPHNSLSSVSADSRSPHRANMLDSSTTEKPSFASGYMHANRFTSPQRACNRHRVHTCTATQITPRKAGSGNNRGSPRGKTPMYMPPQFNAKDPAIALELMRSHPFASLISNDTDGLPFVTHLPLVAEAGESDQLALWGHCAKPNPHWRYLQARPQAVVTFLGPH